MSTAVSKAEPAPASSEAARLFIAMWPPAALARALRSRCDQARGKASARPVAWSRMHLTLHFLGELPRSRLPALQAALCVPFSRFELCFEACTRWPQGLLVAEPVAVPPTLLALHAGLAQRLEALGLRPEERAFRPHVTLARRHQGAWPAAAQGTSPLCWTVGQYSLVESQRGPPSSYRRLHTCDADIDARQERLMLLA